MHLADLIPIFFINLRLRIIRILNRIRILFNSAVTAVQIGFQRFQIIGVHSGEHICYHIDHIDISLLFFLSSGFLSAFYHRGKVDTGTLDLQRIFR